MPLNITPLHSSYLFTSTHTPPSMTVTNISQNRNSFYLVQTCSRATSQSGCVLQNAHAANAKTCAILLAKFVDVMEKQML